MKCLLAALNAKYIHSNPGIYSLKAYAMGRLEQDSACLKREISVELGEYTINNQMGDILKDIYLRKPDIIGFSCYIWNITWVMELVRDLPSVLPEAEIWLGGPEVSYDAADILEREPNVTGIMMGEGEETFLEVLKHYAEGRRDFFTIDGVACRNEKREVVSQPLKKAADMSAIPFPYEDLHDFEHKIVYYESSRGCPFSCSYCLSSLDKSVRFRNLELVKRELDFFLEHRVPQVKFVDRTFNCSKKHTMEVWRHITEHDNGVTNFHFEISADLLDEEELELMAQMRPGLIQLEIGVQSTNPDTIREIRRKTDLNRLKSVVERIHGFGNIHCHLDLIAGLPYEGYESFRNSFNEVYGMKPDQLQLGFLKVLKGSYMAENAEAYGLVYSAKPPYEVLGTKWLDYESLLKLKGVEEMVEVYENSGQFTVTMKELVKEFDTPFDLFSELAEYYEAHTLTGVSHSRMARYEILDRFVGEHIPDKLELYRRLMVYDLYLRENLKSRPDFAEDQTPFKEKIREFFAKEAVNHRYLREGYEGFEARQLIKMAHLEVFGGKTAVLFDYRQRDPLSYNAAAFVIDEFFH
ncbi:B12-binding domain-containing radical SAM protein [Hungatella hathewayi]|uniref:B12-binding domain-containing radical SAM protein n=1 Tax=Hungatella hathewayi TaxID=154046 RepID=UPI003219AA79